MQLVLQDDLYWTLVSVASQQKHKQTLSNVGQLLPCMALNSDTPQSQYEAQLKV